MPEAVSIVGGLACGGVLAGLALALAWLTTGHTRPRTLTPRDYFLRD